MSDSALPRWMGVGAAADPDAAVAARAAVTEALAGREAAVVLVFSSPRYDAATVARAAQATTQAPVAGCTTSGEIAGGTAGSGRIVAVAIGGEGVDAAVAVGDLDDDPADAGRAAAGALTHVDGAYKTLVLLSDGVVGHHAAMVRGAYSVAGATVALVGGSAGDEMEVQRTFQFAGGRATTHAVVGVAIASPAPIGVGVGHGWSVDGEPMVVTESDGSRVYRLDDRPALDAFLEQAGIEEVERTTAEWNQLALLRPFGMPRGQEHEIRAVLGLDFGQRSLRCSDVPQGAVVTLMQGDCDSVLRGTKEACAQALESLDGATPIGAIAFDCAARRTVLGEEGLSAEMRVIADELGGVEVAGFYTYGEVARTRGARGVHSATLVVMVMS